MPADKPLSREEFLERMAIEAKKLERFARELREGKWDSFHIDETFTRDRESQERATVVIRASRLQARGTGRTVVTDGDESPPRRAHCFEGSWQPQLEKRGDENERYQETCSECGLTIVDPIDAYPVDQCPPVKALTPEWLELMSYPVECNPEASGETALRAADAARARSAHEVIRKLMGVSEQANGVPGGNEHQDEEGARKAQASELRNLAIVREPIDQRAGNGEEHGNQSSHR